MPKNELKNSYLYPGTPILQYFQFPEFLLRAKISQTARILYMVLYDRARLSQKNNWSDDNGKVYLVYPLLNLAEKTGRSVSAVKAGLNELMAEDLLEKKRTGLGKPNRLYVKVPTENGLSEGLNSDPPTVGKQTPKQINRNNEQSKNTMSPYSLPVKYKGKRTSAFENYEYEEEDSF